jgi:hypothetical protein
MKLPPNHELYDAIRYAIENPPVPSQTVGQQPKADQTYTEQTLGEPKSSDIPPAEKPLPDIMSYGDMLEMRKSVSLPPQILKGVLHKGCKACISGSSKAGKTWSLINLAVSATTGAPWLGIEIPNELKVLYLDFELPSRLAIERFYTVASKLDADEEKIKKNLEYWALRGAKAGLDRLLEHLHLTGRSNVFDLIILDPYYKISGRFDENSAADVKGVLDSIEDFSQETGAAFFFAHHFSKGNKADVDAIDRASGSGVFGRDPDAILTLTKHSEADCLALEYQLRNCPPKESAVVEFSKESFPAFIPRDGLDPKDLNRPSPGQNNENDIPDDDVVALLGMEAMSGEQWRARAIEQGMSLRAFDRARKRLSDDSGPVGVRQSNDDARKKLYFKK